MAYTGDPAAAEPAFVAAVASGKDTASQTIVAQWKQIFELVSRSASIQSDESVELLEAIPNGYGEVSATLHALASLDDQQRRALVAKHIGGLTEAEVAELLELSDAEATVLLTQSEAAFAAYRNFDNTADLMAQHFALLETVVMPAVLPGVEVVGGQRFDRGAVLMALAAGAVAVVGLVLISGNAGLDQTAVTIRKGERDLRMSLVDGTFLPP